MGSQPQDRFSTPNTAILQQFFLVSSFGRCGGFPYTRKTHLMYTHLATCLASVKNPFVPHGGSEMRFGARHFPSRFSVLGAIFPVFPVFLAAAQAAQSAKPGS